ncbi:MAG: hypothetical protein ACI9MC_002496 [Kiritimatiellia bacterium]|jgi:hypothetical protein
MRCRSRALHPACGSLTPDESEGIDGAASNPGAEVKMWTAGST